MAERLRSESEARGAARPDIRDAVRERYAAAALVAEAGEPAACGPELEACGCDPGTGAVKLEEAFGASQYMSEEHDAVPDAARLASLGCGNPTALAELGEGETVLDLGSGGGLDVLLSARRVGPTGIAYGLDMTDEMLELARRNQRRAQIENAEFLRGTIEDIPLPDSSVDVIISNCVINLSGDKPRVFREAARVLRPGGRFAVTDIVADPDMDARTRSDMEKWTGCIAGALSEAEFARQLEAAGFEDIEVRETHRVDEQAGSAIVRARRPA